MVKKQGIFRADYRTDKPFESAEEAWFWFCYCESSDKGKDPKSRNDWSRPCETSDIAIIVKRLVSSRKIGQNHLKVLTKFGLSQMPPHAAFGDSLMQCRLWEEALAVLQKALEEKGIVEQAAVGRYCA